MNTNCLIVGGGPTGLTLGISLLQQGKSVVIIEKRISSIEYSKAVLVNSETLKLLEPCGATAILKTIGFKSNGTSFFTNQNAISIANFDLNNNNLNFDLKVPQIETEACLMKVYLELGGKFLKGWELNSQDIEEKDDKVIVNIAPVSTIRSVAEKEENITVTSDWLFGCDGYHSTVRKYLDIPFEGDHLSDDAYFADLEIERWPHQTDICTFLYVHGFCVAFRIGKNKARISAPNKYLFEEMLKSFVVKSVIWQTSYKIHFQKVNCYGRKKIWIAGDATHVHSPLGGRGMNLGIADAISLANAIKINNPIQYQIERLPVAHKFVNFNRTITIIGNSQHIVARSIRFVLFYTLPIVNWFCGPSTFAKIIFVGLTGVNVKVTN